MELRALPTTHIELLHGKEDRGKRFIYRYISTSNLDPMPEDMIWDLQSISGND